MIYLGLSIVISSLLFVIFKAFEVFKVDTLQAIVVNYLVALICGVMASPIPVAIADIPAKPWFLGAVFLGFLFISIFNVMALTAQKNGLSVASIAGKMSVVIPVIFGVFVYKEALGLWKVIGIVLALLAVYLASAKNDTAPVKLKNLFFPVLLFLGSGTIDTSIKYIETTYVAEGGLPIFSASIFGVAFVFGNLLLLYQASKGAFSFQWKNILGGIVLGIPNYYSIYFLLKALQTDGLESSVLFTMNNVGVVVCTTVFALLLFKEKLIKRNWVGILLAIVSILLMTAL